MPLNKNKKINVHLYVNMFIFGKIRELKKENLYNIYQTLTFSLFPVSVFKLLVEWETWKWNRFFR